MQKGKFNVVAGGQWGSEGKGQAVTALVDRFKPDVISTTNMANAGHTAVNASGDEKWVGKVLPSAAIMYRWSGHRYKPKIAIGASAGFQISRLLEEIKQCEITVEDMMIHPRAGVITDEHVREEGSNDGGPKHVASTMQGCAAMLAEKVLRRKGVMLAKDYSALNEMVPENGRFETEIRGWLNAGNTILHEGSQGFSLDIHWGSHYPQCTSRGTTAIQNMVDMGLTPKHLGSVYIVIRPYPIRVGNVVEDGVQKGYSGDCYEDQHEITWDEVASQCGMPASYAGVLKNAELTTVTKRLRRVFSFSDLQLMRSVEANQADGIILNFANYIDWKCYQQTRLTAKVVEWIERIEYLTRTPVVQVGTGPRYCDVVII